MRLGFDVGLPALVVLVVGIASASPIPFGSTGRQHRRAASPGVLCTTWTGRTVCDKFEVPIIRRSSIQSSPRNAYSSTVIGSGPLISKEDRQIERIMDFKEEAKTKAADNAWLTPDVKLVLWFVLLCCLAEGIVSGFRWWRGTSRTAVERKTPNEKSGPGGLRKVEEEDEDDELNMPVL